MRGLPLVKWGLGFPLVRRVAPRAPTLGTVETAFDLIMAFYNGAEAHQGLVVAFSGLVDVPNKREAVGINSKYPPLELPLLKYK